MDARGFAKLSSSTSASGSASIMMASTLPNNQNTDEFASTLTLTSTSKPKKKALIRRAIPTDSSASPASFSSSAILSSSSPPKRRVLVLRKVQASTNAPSGSTFLENAPGANIRVGEGEWEGIGPKELYVEVQKQMQQQQQQQQQQQYQEEKDAPDMESKYESQPSYTAPSASVTTANNNTLSLPVSLLPSSSSSAQPNQQQPSSFSSSLLSHKDSRCLARWQQTLSSWSSYKSHLASLLSTSSASLSLTRTSAYRSLREEFTLLEQLVPLSEKMGPVQWQMSLRDQGVNYVGVGNMFSGLYCKIKKEEVGKMQIVRRVGGNEEEEEEYKGKSSKHSFASSLSRQRHMIHRIKQFEASANHSAQGFFVTAEDAAIAKKTAMLATQANRQKKNKKLEWLVVRGKDLFVDDEEEEEEKKGKKGKKTIEKGGEMKVIAEEKEKVLENSDTSSSSPLVGLHLSTHQLQFQVETSSPFSTSTSSSISSTSTTTSLSSFLHDSNSIRLYNNTKTVVYYSWQESKQELNSTLNQAAKVTEENEFPRLSNSSTQRFWSVNPSGTLLPGESVSTVFTFTPNQAGLFLQPMKLTTQPNVKLIYNQDESIQDGEKKKDQEEEATILLRGICASIDTNSVRRAELQQQIQEWKQNEITNRLSQLTLARMRQPNPPIEQHRYLFYIHNRNATPFSITPTSSLPSSSSSSLTLPPLPLSHNSLALSYTIPFPLYYSSSSVSSLLSLYDRLLSLHPRSIRLSSPPWNFSCFTLLSYLRSLPSRHSSLLPQLMEEFKRLVEECAIRPPVNQVRYESMKTLVSEVVSGIERVSGELRVEGGISEKTEEEERKEREEKKKKEWEEEQAKLPFYMRQSNMPNSSNNNKPLSEEERLAASRLAAEQASQDALARAERSKAEAIYRSKLTLTIKKMLLESLAVFSFVAEPEGVEEEPKAAEEARKKVKEDEERGRGRGRGDGGMIVAAVASPLTTVVTEAPPAPVGRRGSVDRRGRSRPSSGNKAIALAAAAVAAEAEAVAQAELAAATEASSAEAGAATALHSQRVTGLARLLSLHLSRSASSSSSLRLGGWSTASPLSLPSSTIATTASNSGGIVGYNLPDLGVHIETPEEVAAAEELKKMQQYGFGMNRSSSSSSSSSSSPSSRPLYVLSSVLNERVVLVSSCNSYTIVSTNTRQVYAWMNQRVGKENKDGTGEEENEGGLGKKKGGSAKGSTTSKSSGNKGSSNSSSSGKPSARDVASPPTSAKKRDSAIANASSTASSSTTASGAPVTSRAKSLTKGAGTSGVSSATGSRPESPALPLSSSSSSSSSSSPPPPLSLFTSPLSLLSSSSPSSLVLIPELSGYTYLSLSCGQFLTALVTDRGELLIWDRETRKVYKEYEGEGGKGRIWERKNGNEGKGGEREGEGEKGGQTSSEGKKEGGDATALLHSSSAAVTANDSQRTLVPDRSRLGRNRSRSGERGTTDSSTTTSGVPPSSASSSSSSGVSSQPVTADASSRRKKRGDSAKRERSANSNAAAQAEAVEAVHAAEQARIEVDQQLNNSGKRIIQAVIGGSGTLSSNPAYNLSLPEFEFILVLTEDGCVYSSVLPTTAAADGSATTSPATAATGSSSSGSSASSSKAAANKLLAAQMQMLQAVLGQGEKEKKEDTKEVKKGAEAAASTTVQSASSSSPSSLLSLSLISSLHPLSLSRHYHLLPHTLRVVSLSAGYSHALARLSNGSVASWGWGEYGALGLGVGGGETAGGKGEKEKGRGETEKERKVRNVPVLIPAFNQVAAIASTPATVSSSSSTKSSSSSSHPLPLPLSSASTSTLPVSAPITSIAAGAFHSVALSSEGVLYTFGRSNEGQCGDWKDRDTPTVVQYFTQNFTTMTASQAGMGSSSSSSTSSSSGGNASARGRSSTSNASASASTTPAPAVSSSSSSAPAPPGGEPIEIRISSIAAGANHTLVLVDAKASTAEAAQAEEENAAVEMRWKEVYVLGKGIGNASGGNHDEANISGNTAGSSSSSASPCISRVRLLRALPVPIVDVYSSADQSYVLMDCERRKLTEQEQEKETDELQRVAKLLVESNASESGARSGGNNSAASGSGGGSGFGSSASNGRGFGGGLGTENVRDMAAAASVAAIASMTKVRSQLLDAEPLQEDAVVVV